MSGALAKAAKAQSENQTTSRFFGGGPDRAAVPFFSVAVPRLQRKCAGCEAEEERRIQTKLTVGEPDDKYEREADRVAEQVMRMPEPGLVSPAGDSLIVRRQESLEEEGDEELVQAKTAGGVTPEVTPAISAGIRSLRGGGRPLSSSERRFFQPRFGVALSEVRVHTDAKAAGMAHSVKARAFTLGSDVVFGAGEYSPGTVSGRKLLAHELVHVIQQSASGGTAAPCLQRARFQVGSETIQIDYGNLIGISPADYQGAIETRFAAWTGIAAATISADLTALTNDQRRWVLFAFDILVDNTTAAHSGLNRADAVRRLIAHAPSATTVPLGGSFADFGREALRVSGWFETALSARLTAPSGAGLTAITSRYNPVAGGALDPQFEPLLRAGLMNLLNTLTLPSSAIMATQNLGDLQSAADTIQAEARTFFSPYADTAINNIYVRGWTYSSNLSGMTSASAAPTPELRRSYLRNRAQIVGWDRSSGPSLFERTNYNSLDLTHRAELERVITAMAGEAPVIALLDPIIRRTGRASRGSGAVSVSLEYRTGGAAAECNARWRSVYILAHELVHQMVHPDFVDKARTIQFGQIIREGFTEVLGNQFYNDPSNGLRERARTDPAFKARLEVGVPAPPAPCAPPPARPIGYREAGSDAEAIRSRVGDDNFRAAYFLGATDLVGL